MNSEKIGGLDVGCHHQRHRWLETNPWPVKNSANPCRWPRPTRRSRDQGKTTPPPPPSPWSWPLSGDRRRSASAPIRPRTCENVRILELFYRRTPPGSFPLHFPQLVSMHVQFRSFSSLKRTLKVIWSLSYSLKHQKKNFLQKVYYILFAFLCLTVYQQPSF